MARRIYRRFVYGLSRIGKMQVFTSSGAGTWGPPLRLGSNPEIVVLQFEQSLRPLAGRKTGRPLPSSVLTCISLRCLLGCRTTRYIKAIGSEEFGDCRRLDEV